MATVSPGIQQRGNGYYVQVSKKNVGRLNGTAHTLEEAVIMRQKFKAQLESGEINEKETKRGWTFGQAADKTYIIKWEDGSSAKTYTTYIRQLKQYIGADTHLSAIDTDFVDGVIEHFKAKGNAGGTINRKLSCLRSILSVAFERGRINKVPTVAWQKESNGRIRFLTRGEEKAHMALATQMEKPWYCDAFIILIDTGMRTGELRSLTVRDVDLKSKLISIWENKADHPRSVYMTSRVYEIMKRRCAGKNSTDKVCEESRKNWLRSTWNTVKKTLGLSDDEQYIPHALRHTCCSRLVQKGVPLKVVQEWMGHKVIETTMRYAHLAPMNFQNAAQLLDEDTTNH